MTDPRVRERLPFVGTDDPFQAVALVRVRDVVEVHGPAPECDTSERPPFPRQLNSHTSILAAPLRCVSRNFTGDLMGVTKSPPDGRRRAAAGGAVLSSAIGIAVWDVARGEHGVSE